MLKVIAISSILLIAIFGILSAIQVLTKKPLRSGSCKNNADNMNTTCGCDGGSCESI